MKPPKFHIGQAVVCVDSSPTVVHPDFIEDQLNGPDPICGPIYEVDELDFYDGEWWVGLVGFTQYHYDERSFAPVEELPAAALAELLEETLAPTVAV